MKNWNFIPIFFLFFLSCARIVPLTGGDLDVLPPKPVRYQPDSAALNFKNNIIKIRFNEFIQLKDPTREIMSSPALHETPTFQVRGKNLFIRLADKDLLPNTTYLIQFGNSIADITEGNILKNFFYVFSTGSTLDTLEFSGNIITFPSLEPGKDFKIFLYPDTIPDSSILHVKPLYFVRTSSEGSFQFRFLRYSTYKIAALKEENNNFIYDRPGEFIAFDSQKVILQERNPSRSLQAFSENLKKITRSEIGYYRPGEISLPFLPHLSYSLKFGLSDSIRVIKDIVENMDSVRFYFPESEVSKECTLLISNSITESVDTISFKTKFSNTTLRKGRGTSKYLPLLYTNIKASSTNFKTPLQLTYSDPVIKIDTSGISIRGPEGEQNFKIFFQDSSQRKIIMETSLMPDREYSLKIREHTFTGLSGLKNDSLKVNFKTISSTAFGYIYAGLEDNLYKNGELLLDLMDENLKTLIKRVNLRESEIKLIGEFPTGRYRLRFIYDRNANGIWDSGSLKDRLPPEEIVLISQFVELAPGISQKIVWRPGSERKKSD